MAIIDKKYVFIAAAGLVVGLAVVYTVKKAAGAVTSIAGDALNSINPLSNDNIINQGFNKVYQSVTGSDGTLGSDMYDVLNKSPEQIAAEKKKNEQDAQNQKTILEQTGWDATPGIY